MQTESEYEDILRQNARLQLIEETFEHKKELFTLFADMQEISVAVSGGIDSITLAMLAHQTPNVSVRMYHAVSPAVPRQATERVKQLALEFDWDLQILNAQEFQDEGYLSNPVNRCFFCKTNLYKAISTFTEGVIFSGANMDDLSDYRPGLQAARNASVRHPFVETGTDKKMVRAIAKQIGLEHLSELPSSPCLSSRVETGIRIDPDLLPLINEVELLIKQLLSPEPKTVRCRIRAHGLVVELDHEAAGRLTLHKKEILREKIAQVFRVKDHKYPVRFEEYKIGSAFIHLQPMGTVKAQ